MHLYSLLLVNEAMVALKKMTMDPEPPTLPKLPPIAKMAAGFVVASIGIALAVTGAFEADSDPRALIGVPAGLIFVFGGALILLPRTYARGQLPLVALTVTSLAVVFNWVAFGPGEREFAGPLSSGGGTATGAAREMTGRLFYGFIALIMDIAALGLWIKVFARLRNKE
jgi:hypothetical protein